MRVEDLWREIEMVASREELRAAVETVDELVPHLDEDDEGDVRAKLSERIRLVSGFLRELCEVIELGSNAEGEPVLAEMRRMPWLLDHRRKLKACDIDEGLVRGSWRRLVYGQKAGGGRDGRAQRVRVLRADAVSPASQAARHLRAQIVAVA